MVERLLTVLSAGKLLSVNDQFMWGASLSARQMSLFLLYQAPCIDRDQLCGSACLLMSCFSPSV